MQLEATTLLLLLRRPQGSTSAAAWALAARRGASSSRKLLPPLLSHSSWSSAASGQKRQGQRPRRCASQTASQEGKEALTTPLAFEDAKLAFASKSTFELLRGWAIFKVCGWGWVVRHCDTLYGLSNRLLGGTITHMVMRHSMFAHFCAGESAKDIMPRMAQLRGLGVGGILDYAAEAKDEAPKAAAVADEAVTVGAPLSARSFAYTGEAVCDANAEIFLTAIRGVRDASPEGFAAVKLSGLGDPKLLERMTTCLTEIHKLFLRLSTGTDSEDVMRTPYYCMDRSFALDFPAFSAGWRRLFTVSDEEQLRKKFDSIDGDGDGLITFGEWQESVKLSNLNDLALSCVDEGPLHKATLDEEEVQLYFKLISRVERILDLAQELGVRVMVDAEWTDIQPAIDHLVVFLQRKYNRGDRPTVFQTYQTYLKGMHDSVAWDLQRSSREGWLFGAKVVRGAYMVSEREKAKVRGLESPICETYEDTEANYHACINSILSESSQGSPPEVVIASHNRHSIEFAVRRMEEVGRDPGNGVYFGQLMGMADHLTFTLARHGYKSYKYVPYGPIDEVVPYLIRRTQENSAILGSPGVQEERQMVREELRRRLSPV